MTAGELAECFPLAKSTLSGHFNVLRSARLVVSEKRGTTIVYSLNVSAVEQALVALMDLAGSAGRRKEMKP
jgi:DNA-binding transcriptional ArsR family regulator